MARIENPCIECGATTCHQYLLGPVKKCPLGLKIEGNDQKISHGSFSERFPALRLLGLLSRRSNPKLDSDFPYKLERSDSF
jgi:hypothetical protein